MSWPPRCAGCGRQMSYLGHFDFACLRCSGGPRVHAPMEPFQVLVADPPWPFGDKLPGPSRGAEKNHDVLTMDEIMNFQLPPLDGNAWLFLWRVPAMQQEALDTMEAWGFKLKSEIVWRKLTSGGLPWFGMGRYVRASHETCLIGVRGRVQPMVRNVRSVFEAKVPERGHSAKPDEFYTIVEQLTGPARKVELFARVSRPGWTCLGNEVPEEKLLITATS